MPRKPTGRHAAPPIPLGVRLKSPAMKLSSAAALTALGLTGLTAAPAAADERPSSQTTNVSSEAPVDDSTEATAEDTEQADEPAAEEAPKDDAPAEDEPAEEPAPNAEPTLAGAGDTSVAHGAGFDALAGVSASDAEDGDLTGAISVEGNVDTDTPGSYKVVYTVTDSSGASATVTRTVTVDEPANTAPTFSGVSDSTISQGDSFDALAGVSASDAEDGDITGSIKVSGSVDASTVGTYTLTYSVTDSAGETVEATRTVTVANEAPVFAGVDDTEVQQGGDFDPMAGVSASDAEDGDLTSKIEVEGSVDTSTEGTYTLTYRVTDSGGETVEATRTVTVANEAPVFEGVDDTEVQWNGDFDALDGVTASDREDGDLTGKIEVSGSVDTSTVGEYTVTYSVTDSGGETTEATRTISVVNEAPVFEGVEDADVAQGSDFDPMAGVSASDREDGDLTGSIKVEGSVDTSEEGTYTLTYTVTDAAGETVEATRTVSVTNEAPVFEGVDDKTVVERADFDPLEGVKATDREDGDLTDKIEVTGSVDTNVPGTYKLTYAVTDSFGKTTSAERTITVEVYDGAPVFKGVDEVTVSQGSDFDPLAGVSASDESDGDLTDKIEVVSNGVDTGTAGKYTVVYRVTNSFDNSTTVERTVVVVNDAPTISGAGNTEVQWGGGFDPYSGVSAYDKQDGDLTGSIKVEGWVDTSTEGDYTLTYRVTDSGGETTTVSRVVSVVNAAPEFSGVGDTSVAEGGAFDPMAGVSASDREDGDLTGKIEVEGWVDTSTAGDYTLTYRVTDAAGKTAEATRVVTVTSGEDPTDPDPDPNPDPDPEPDPDPTDPDPTDPDPTDPDPTDPDPTDPDPEEPGEDEDPEGSDDPEDPAESEDPADPEEPGDDPELPGLDPDAPEDETAGSGDDDLPGLSGDEDGNTSNEEDNLPGLDSGEDPGAEDLPGLSGDEDSSTSDDEEDTPGLEREDEDEASPTPSPSEETTPDTNASEAPDAENGAGIWGWIAGALAAVAAAATGLWLFLFGRRKNDDEETG